MARTSSSPQCYFNAVTAPHILDTYLKGEKKGVGGNSQLDAFKEKHLGNKFYLGLVTLSCVEQDKGYKVELMFT